MVYTQLIDWLMEGDPSIQFQVSCDLLNKEDLRLQKEIENEGWGKYYLSLQNENGHWGKAFYQPKWTSTHYTLLDLRNLCISPDVEILKQTIDSVLRKEMCHDYKKKYEMIVNQDICINGMVLNYSSFFQADLNLLKPIVDFILSNQMSDGGFNCHSNSIGARHSSLHTTLSVLEGLYEYRKNGYNYRLMEIKKVEKECIEFILMHKLYKSDKTGKIIKLEFTRMPYPPRWRYDFLRCLDFFRYANVKYDNRMDDAIELLIKKRKQDGTWFLQANHPGKIHFEMEKAEKASRWNTLRSLRVLNKYNAL